MQLIFYEKKLIYVLKFVINLKLFLISNDFFVGRKFFSYLILYFFFSQISIHSLGHRPLDSDHPENRAILYEDITYSKRKIQDFLGALAGLKIANEIVEIFSKWNDISLSSSLLKKIIYRNNENTNENFPYLNEILDYYTNAFSHTQARNEGKIIPSAGVCKQYDDSLNEIRENEKALNDYLNKQKKILKNHDIKYVHVQKIRYAMEISDNACRNLDDDYELMSSRKGFKR